MKLKISFTISQLKFKLLLLVIITHSSTNDAIPHQFSCTMKMLRKRIETFTSKNSCISCPHKVVESLNANKFFEPLKMLCDRCSISYAEIQETTRIDLCPGCVQFNKTCTQDELDPDDNCEILLLSSEIFIWGCDGVVFVARKLFCFSRQI